MDELGGFNRNTDSGAADTSLVSKLLDNSQSAANETETFLKPAANDTGNLNLLDQVRHMGIDYDRGKAALVESIQQPSR